MSRKVLLIALLGALGVAVVPEFLPTGPDASLDASRFLDSGQFLIGALVIFGGGLLTALTPCVYPLIPITVSLFGASKAESRLKAVGLTSSYILGMAVVFSALGVVAALTGALFGAALSNPWVITVLALFMIALAASMFGAFELQLPPSLAQRLNTVGGGGVIGAFLMGSVSGFIAAPCTGPVLTGVLAFVARTQSAVVGGSLLFIYALGVGLPFFLIGVFALRLPKGGAWMEQVKSVLGIALLALAAAYVKDAVPALREGLGYAATQLGKMPAAAIAAVITALGVLFGAVHLSFKEGTRHFIIKAVGVTLVVGAVTVRMAALGAPETGQAWVKLGLAEAPKKEVLTWHLTFPTPQNAQLASFDETLAKAKAEGRPVMIDFFAEWCAACKELDHKTYVADPVVSEASRFVNIKIDGTNEDEVLEKLYERFGVQGLPTVAFIDSTGKLLNDPKVTGFLNAEKFVREMKKVR